LAVTLDNKLLERNAHLKVLAGNRNKITDGSQIYPAGPALVEGGGGIQGKISGKGLGVGNAGIDWYDDQLPDIRGLDEVAAGNVRKVSIKCLPEDLDAVRELLLGRLGSRANIVKADVNFINIMDAGVSKGMALQWLLEYLGIPAADAMAVGDCEADQSMFSVARVSVAVANADEQTLAMARYVVPSNNEQGAAVALENFAGGSFGR